MGTLHFPSNKQQKNSGSHFFPFVFPNIQKKKNHTTTQITRDPGVFQTCGRKMLKGKIPQKHATVHGGGELIHPLILLKSCVPEG